ncbi:MAG: hypothetical protein CMH98_01205, partial [Oceanospirillaceae bacterium]|nr:hypothetical protein [Oceanospirillaceae bacterium]
MSLFTDPLSEAKHYFSLGFFERAEKSIRHSTSEENREQHLALLYKILFYAGKYKQLIYEAEQHSALKSRDRETCYFLYQSYMAVQHYPAAIKAIDAFLHIDIEDLPTLMDKAICYYHLKQLDNAEGIIRKIIELQPESAVAYNNLANILKDKKELDAAQNAYEKAIQLQPNMADAYVGAGIIARQKGEFAHCEQRFLSAIDVNSRHYLARYHLATLYKSNKEYDKSIQQWLILTEQYPYAEDNYFILCNLYRQQGDIEQAIVILERCLTINPHNSNAQHLCAALKQETTESAPEG